MGKSATANPRRRTAVKPAEDMNVADVLEHARRVVEEHEAERNGRVQGFLDEFHALCAKYQVEIRTKPVELEVVPIESAP